MDGWNSIILYTLIACLLVPFLVRLVTRFRAIWIAISCVAVVFVLFLVGWFSVELALFAAFLALAPALVGAGLGALAKEFVR